MTDPKLTPREPSEAERLAQGPEDLGQWYGPRTFDEFARTIDNRYKPKDSNAGLERLRDCWAAATKAERERCAAAAPQPAALPDLPAHMDGESIYSSAEMHAYGEACASAALKGKQ